MVDLRNLDIYSIALTTLSSLLRDYQIDPLSIGRLEVGTETILDKSKSVKTVLMQLFEGNTNIEGVDTLNACYGGTNALFNSLNWVESTAWDGRDAIVVAGDIAVYPQGAARPTGGAGCVAMLIGPDAPLVIEQGLRGSYMAHTYDFYKPDLKSEYAIVDGHYSIQCYMKALDECYKAYKARQKMGSWIGKKSGVINGYNNGTQPDIDNINGQKNGFHTNGASEDDRLALETPMDQFDFMCFHSPTTKIVAKSYARLLYNDFLSNPESPFFKEVSHKLRELSAEVSSYSKAVEKEFTALSAKRFMSCVQPSTLVGTMCGNIYTASVYGSLISLICNVNPEDLLGKRVGVFSYGSGLASTMFSLRVKSSLKAMVEKIRLHERLKGRMTVSPQAFVEACSLRERAHLKNNFVPTGDIEHMAPQTWYLDNVDSMFRRSYKIR
jgi:hydroxymethylglutaryl-CoA synthase